jgi:hypothetical protein
VEKVKEGVAWCSLQENLKFWVELCLLKIPAKLQFQGRANRDSGDYDAVASIVWSGEIRGRSRIYIPCQ